MAHILYKVQKTDQGAQYTKRDNVALAGNRNGVIVKYLRAKMNGASEPVKWSMNIAEALRILGLDGDALVIDLKPYNREGVVSLFEILNIWGYSAFGWTPIMLQLQELAVDEDPAVISKENFVAPMDRGNRFVYTFLFLSGTIKQGQIEGTWNFTRPSPANSVLLWPEAMDYLMEKAGYRRI